MLAGISWLTKTSQEVLADDLFVTLFCGKK